MTVFYSVFEFVCMYASGFNENPHGMTSISLLDLSSIVGHRINVNPNIVRLTFAERSHRQFSKISLIFRVY